MTTEQTDGKTSQTKYTPLDTKIRTHYAVLSLEELERMVAYIKHTSSKENVANKCATIVLNFAQINETGQLWLTKGMEERLKGVENDN